MRDVLRLLLALGLSPLAAAREVALAFAEPTDGPEHYVSATTGERAW